MIFLMGLQVTQIFFFDTSGKADNYKIDKILLVILHFLSISFDYFFSFIIFVTLNQFYNGYRRAETDGRKRPQTPYSVDI